MLIVVSPSRSRPTERRRIWKPTWRPDDISTARWWWAGDTAGLKQVSDGTGAVSATGDPVGYLDDISANSDTLMQAVEAARFSYQSDGIAPGIASIRCDGVDDHLFIASALGLGGNDTPYSFIASYVPRTVAGTFSNLWSANKTGANVPWHSLRHGNTNAWTVARIGDDSVTHDPLAGTVVVNTKYVVEVYFTGMAVTLIVNGSTLLNAVALDSAAMTGLDRFSLGCLMRITKSNFFHADIRQVMLVPGSVISDSDQNGARNWFRYDLGGWG